MRIQKEKEGIILNRIDKIQNRLEDFDIDAILITSKYNLRYASQFTGTSGLALITANQAYFITDFRYTEQANEQAIGYTVIESSQGLYQEVANRAKELGIERLGFEMDYTSVATYKEFKKIFEAELVPVSGLVEQLREYKEKEEVQTIKRAIKITESALEHITEFIKPGISEIQVANELDFHMRSLGATEVSFETIVASGKRSAMPHGVASEKLIEQGDLITIDFGCYYKGYVSDMTRTFALGDPGDQLREIYEIVRQANQKVHENLRIGMTGKEIDAIARDFITEKGYGKYFGHSTGHGIGLEIHEDPGINSRNNQPIKAGHVITNEPGIYLPGIGGVRIEDDIYMSEEGPENLMTFPTELIIL